MRLVDRGVSSYFVLGDQDVQIRSPNSVQQDPKVQYSTYIALHEPGPNPYRAHRRSEVEKSVLSFASLCMSHRVI